MNYNDAYRQLADLFNRISDLTYEGAARADSISNDALQAAFEDIRKIAKAYENHCRTWQPPAPIESVKSEYFDKVKELVDQVFECHSYLEMCVMPVKSALRDIYTVSFGGRLIAAYDLDGIVLYGWRGFEDVMDIVYGTPEQQSKWIDNP